MEKHFDQPEELRRIMERDDPTMKRFSDEQFREQIQNLIRSSAPSRPMKKRVILACLIGGKLIGRRFSRPTSSTSGVELRGKVARHFRPSPKGPKLLPDLPTRASSSSRTCTNSSIFAQAPLLEAVQPLTRTAMAQLCEEANDSFG